MSIQLYLEIQSGLHSALVKVAALRGVALDLLNQPAVVGHCEDISHGDFFSNIAFQYGQTFNMKPRDLADVLVVAFPPLSSIAEVAVSKSGMINFRLTRDQATAVLVDIVREGAQFGTYLQESPELIVVEFLTIELADPIELSLNSIRTIVHGDNIRRLINTCGRRTKTECYIDTDSQAMQTLIVSVYWRYLQQYGQKEAPCELNSAKYVDEIAQQLQAEMGETLVLAPEIWLSDSPTIQNCIESLRIHLGKEQYSRLRAMVINQRIAAMSAVLAQLDVTIDNWQLSHEIDDKHIESVLMRLIEQQLAYKKGNTLWIRSTTPNHPDKVLMRKKLPTALARRIVYQLDKPVRSVGALNILSAENEGSINAQAVSIALSRNSGKHGVQIVQDMQVHDKTLEQSGDCHDASSELSTLIGKVGMDMVRFSCAQHKPSERLILDVSLAQRHSKKNPLYYVTYAHSCTRRLLVWAEKSAIVFDTTRTLESRKLLVSSEEKVVLGVLRRYPEVVLTACLQRLMPSIVVNYLRDLASAWYHFYDVAHDMLRDNDERCRARLLLTRCVGQVLGNALAMIGVSIEGQEEWEQQNNAERSIK